MNRVIFSLPNTLKGLDELNTCGHVLNIEEEYFIDRIMQVVEHYGLWDALDSVGEHSQIMDAVEMIIEEKDLGGDSYEYCGVFNKLYYSVEQGLLEVKRFRRLNNLNPNVFLTCLKRINKTDVVCNYGCDG